MASDFYLLGADQKIEICKAIEADMVGREDACGFITVSAFQSYNLFYQGLEAELAEWTINKLEGELETLEATASTMAVNTSLGFVDSQAINGPAEGVDIGVSSADALDEVDGILDAAAEPANEAIVPAALEEEPAVAAAEPAAVEEPVVAAVEEPAVADEVKPNEPVALAQSSTSIESLLANQAELERQVQALLAA